MLIDAGTNEEQHALLLGICTRIDFIIRKIVHHVDAQCLQCCHINTVATPAYNIQGILFFTLTAETCESVSSNCIVI